MRAPATAAGARLSSRGARQRYNGWNAAPKTGGPMPQTHHEEGKLSPAYEDYIEAIYRR